MSEQSDVLEFDVAVIGAGPGGYVAALRCALPETFSAKQPA